MQRRDPVPSIYERVDLKTFGLLQNGSDRKFELFDGVIRMTGPASMAHCRIRGNLLIQLNACFDGTGFHALPRFGARVDDHSFLLPHAAVFPIGLDPQSTSGDAVVVAETHELHRHDQERDERVALYRRVPTVRAILIADPYAEHMQVHDRLGPHSWRDEVFTDGRDVTLSSLGLAIPYAEIFSRD